jgi:glycosyltransferase involved in cell wall biosynthesis
MSVKPSVSVVIPVHNTQDLLAACLHSVTRQTLRDIEIICVDDASTDGSAAVLAEWARRDPRISVVAHATRQGVGPARNSGIRAARADYIASVDSDDTIDPEMLATLHAEAVGGDFDIVCCGTRVVDEGGRVLDRWVRPDATVIVTDHHRDLFDLMDPMVWNKLWRRSIFVEQGVWFPGGTRHEDLGGSYAALMKARRIRIIGRAFYNYLVRPGSLSGGFDLAHLVDHVVTFERMRGAMLAEGLEADNAASFGRAVHGALSHHAHKARDFGAPGPETLRYLRCILAIKRAYLAPGRPEEALMDAAQIATAIDLPPEIDRDPSLRERDAALQERDAARRERDTALSIQAETAERLGHREAEIARLAARLRDLSALPRAPHAVLRWVAALHVAFGRLSGRRRTLWRGARLRAALRRLGPEGRRPE